MNIYEQLFALKVRNESIIVRSTLNVQHNAVEDATLNELNVNIQCDC